MLKLCSCWALLLEKRKEKCAVCQCSIWDVAVPTNVYRNYTKNSMSINDLRDTVIVWTAENRSSGNCKFSQWAFRLENLCLRKSVKWIACLSPAHFSFPVWFSTNSEALCCESTPFLLPSAPQLLCSTVCVKSCGSRGTHAHTHTAHTHISFQKSPAFFKGWSSKLCWCKWERWKGSWCCWPGAPCEGDKAYSSAVPLAAFGSSQMKKRAAEGKKKHTHTVWT